MKETEPIKVGKIEPHYHPIKGPAEVVPHEAKITDTFAMGPPAAFHALTDICNDVGNELLSCAQHLRQNPQTVDRSELVASLRRLGQRCFAGVRQASMRPTPDVVVDVHQGVPPPPPPPPPSMVGSGGYSGPSQHEPQQRVPVSGARASCSDHAEGSSSFGTFQTDDTPRFPDRVELSQLSDAPLPTQGIE